MIVADPAGLERALRARPHRISHKLEKTDEAPGGIRGALTL